MDKNENIDFMISDSELKPFDFSFDELTPEKIEEANKKRAMELKSKGFLPKNEEFEETMYSPQELVENNPRKFIIEECIPACQELWSKNIYTFMVSDHLNEGECWKTGARKIIRTSETISNARYSCSSRIHFITRFFNGLLWML